ncbi:MAG: hypothetical protein ACR2L1_07510 [Pyrinomonadaceae bacterium]
MIVTETKNKKSTDTNFFAKIIAAIDNTEQLNGEISRPIASNNQSAKDSFFESRAIGQSFQPEQSISRKLDSMVEAGAAFDVAEYNFEVIGSKNLTESELQYLIANEKAVLCTLHQKLLMKYWFCYSADLLENFASDIYERESIMAEENRVYSYDTYFEAVSGTSQK